MCNLLNATFPERNAVTKSTVERTVKRFKLTNSVADLRQGRPKTSTDEKTLLDILKSYFAIVILSSYYFSAIRFC